MRKKRRSAYLLESLEARLLFSADLAPLPVDSGSTGAEFESDLEISLQPDSAGVQEADENTQERQEVIFVDSGVDDYQQLIDDIESQLEKGRQFDIVSLDSDSDGIDQISAYLRQHEDLDAVHVVSHGSEDAVKLGNVWLTPDKLDAYADAIEGWQQSLSSDADLLFYGCNLAAGDGGQDLVNSLTLLTGADVAASDDVTGNAQFSGDWVLEYKSGQIEASVPFSVDLQSNWSGLLNTFTVTTTADGGAGSLRQAIIDANALPGADEITLNPGTYTLSLGELVITSDLTINGADARTTLIDGNAADRVFKIDGNSTATLTGITVMNGNQNNSGGVFVENGSTLYLSDTIVRDNTSNMGGGIHVHGTAYLERVLLYNNTAGQGGGIHFHDTADGSLTNVTISNNSATSEGGGLWTNMPITVTNSTIAYNTAPAGGGVFDTDGLEITLNNSILYNPGSTNANQALTSGDYNIDSDGTAGLGLGNDRVVNPFIAPLADNGGTTPTHALLAASVDAIDRVGLGGAPSLDGRGAARDGSPDIGAYEYSAKSTGTVGEFLFNDGHETGIQETSGDVDHSQRAVAVADDGSYVVVWSSDNQDASGWGVYAQRFDKFGVELTGEFRVNEIEAGNEQWARMVSDGSGNFVVTWTSDHSGTVDVYARRFDRLGTALGGEFRVNTTTSNDQKDSSIAMDAFGNFVVVWEGQGASDSAGVFYRRFYANGTTMDATEQRANPSDNGTEEDASVGMNAAGDFVVVWLEDNEVKFQLFDKDGTPGTGNRVFPGPHASSPDVAMDAQGNFVVVYRWNDSIGRGIWGHKFDSSGTEQLPWFRVGPAFDNFDNRDHNNPSITMDDLGNFIVTYESDAEGEAGNKTVFAERFQSDTTSLGRFVVNQTAAGDQHMASIAMLDLDNYVVAFTGDDADQTGVFARQYGTAVAVNNPGTVTIDNTTPAQGDTLTASVSDPDGASGAIAYQWYRGGLAIVGATSSIYTTVQADVGTVITVTADYTDDLLNVESITSADTAAVTNVNDAPTATNLSSTSAYNEGDATVAITDIVVSDVDAGETITATLTLANTAAGSLSANDGASYTAGTGVWTITDTVANVNIALANLVFMPTVTNDLDTTIDVSIDDGDEDASGPLNGTITLDVTPADITADLVVHLEFSEGSGTTAFDSTAYGNDAYLSGAQDWVSGAVGEGFHFDYSDGEDFFEINNAASVENVQEGSFTLAAWFKADDVPPASDAYGIIVKEGWHTGLWYNANKQFVFEHTLVGPIFPRVVSANTYDPGTYHHIAVTLDRPSGTMTLYIDGVLENTSSFTPGAASWEYNSETWKVGTARDVFPTSVDFPAKGSVDDVRIYSRAITAPESAELFSLGNSAPTASGTYTMASTDEDTTSAAVQVSAILSDASITANDVDGDTLGIAIFVQTGLGTWQYSTDGVGGWTDFGTVSPNAALLLSETTWVRYVPDGANSESVEFNFRAWDQSTDLPSINGTPRFGDTAPSGGTTAYSTGNASVALTVSSVNDAPTATNLTSTSSYNEGDATVAITNIVVTDVDSGDTITATLTLNDTSTGSLSASNGATYDGLTGVWSITDTVANVNIALANLFFTPLVNNDMDTTITTHIEDAAGAGPADGTITLDVTPANDVPVATGNTVIASEDVPLVIGPGDFNFTDVEGDSLVSVTITGLNLNGGILTHSAGAVTVTNGMTITAAQLADLTFTSALNDSTDSSFTYTVNDAGSGVTSAVMNITVNAVNDVPVATGNTVIASEDVPLVIGPGDFNFTDTEGDSLVSVTITGLNLNGGTLTHSAGAVTVTNGMTITAAELADLTFTSASNDSTDSSFTYTVNDAGTGVTSAVMNITVNAVNDVPVATGNTVIASEDVPLVIGPGDFNFTDVEGDSLVSVTVTGLNLNGGTLTHSAGAVTVTNGMTITAAELADLTFTSASNDSTDSSFTYTVNDAGTGVTSAVMNITVNAVNDVPVATGNTVIASEDVPLVIGPGDFNFTDVEGDSLVSVTITGLNLNGGTLTHSAGAVTVTNGMTITAAQLADLTFTSALNDSTDCSFTYTVNDAGSGVTSAVMNITVNAVNDVPVATGNTVIASEDVPLVIGPGDFNFTDTEGDSLVSVTITGLNLNGGTLTHSAGAVTVTNGMTITAAQLADLTFTSALNDSTDCSFTYTVNDAGSGVTSAVMNITVNAVNDAGTVTIDNTTPAQGDTLTANVIDSDGASGAITYQWISDGAVIGGANGKTYTTTQGDVGAVMTVTAIYTDDQGAAENLTSLPTAPVTNVNDTPIAVNDNLNAIEDQSMTFSSVTDLLGNDLDMDGDTLTISGFSQPDNGSLADNGDGTFTYTPAENFYDIDGFTYTVNDNKGGSAAGAAIIVVTPVGDTPQVTNVSTDAGVQSGLIDIDRNVNDGAEVTHFKISGITNGTLYLADGVSRIDNSDFITVGQGQAGLRFTPAANSTADGSFNVESSEDGVSVASQSGIATSIISILTTAPQPSEPVPSLPPSGPEEIVSEETEQEENKKLEDVADETDVQAVADDMASVEAPQNSKAPGIKKASLVPGISVFRRADLNSNHDKIPDRSTFLSPQTLKKLVESENLGELKTALRRLDITTLPPDVYKLVRGSLDAVQEEMGNEILIGKTVMGSAIATSVGLSAGYVVWMLKGGSLLASVISSLPAWQLADPLAILVGTKGDEDEDEDEDEDDDTLETIIKDGSRRNEDKEREASELNKHKKEPTKR